MMCAASRAGPENCSVPSSRPCSRTRSSQTSFASKNLITASRIGFGSVRYSAATMPQRHIRRPRSTSE